MHSIMSCFKGSDKIFKNKAHKCLIVFKYQNIQTFCSRMKTPVFGLVYVVLKLLGLGLFESSFFIAIL